MINQYVLATNDDGDLAVRTVSATESSAVTDTNNVITRTDDGKLAIRVVGSGGGDQNNLGYFATLQALQEAYPTAEAGNWAIVGSTDTVWVWDEDTSAWVDTDQKGQVTSVNGATGDVTVQEPLVSGTNIKTINGTSLLGSGDITTEAIQVSTMPTAGAGEIGKVYQFIGTTDANYTHGYFYECVSDGQNPATYSWTAVAVQASSGGLPSQTGNSGKFLTTDGTDASWSDKPIVNSAVGSIIPSSGVSRNLTVGTATFNGSNVYRNIIFAPAGFTLQNYVQDSVIFETWTNKTFSHSSTVAIGSNMSQYGLNNSVCIGYGSGSSQSFGPMSYTVIIGSGAKVGANYATQLNLGKNSDANTFKVGNQNGNFEIMSADGTIPQARLVHAINKYSSMPTAASTNEGWIVQYTGATDATYTHGYIYECVSDGGNPATYSWVQVNVQPASSGGGVPTLTWYSVSTAGNTLTIADTSSAQLVKIYKNGLLLQPTEDYTISGTTLTTVAALVVGDKITMEIF